MPSTSDKLTGRASPRGDVQPCGDSSRHQHHPYPELSSSLSPPQPMSSLHKPFLPISHLLQPSLPLPSPHAHSFLPPAWGEDPTGMVPALGSGPSAEQLPREPRAAHGFERPLRHTPASSRLSLSPLSRPPIFFLFIRLTNGQKTDFWLFPAQAAHSSSPLGND